VWRSRYTLQNQVAIDFISTHQYPRDHQVAQTLEGHSQAIAEAAAQIGSDERQLPMYLTEYAINNHDSVAAAAGIISYVARLSGVLPLYRYMPVDRAQCAAAAGPAAAATAAHHKNAV
jgi:hypothetical protein